MGVTGCKLSKFAKWGKACPLPESDRPKLDADPFEPPKPAAAPPAKAKKPRVGKELAKPQVYIAGPMVTPGMTAEIERAMPATVDLDLFAPDDNRHDAEVADAEDAIKVEEAIKAEAELFGELFSDDADNDPVNTEETEEDTEPEETPVKPLAEALRGMFRIGNRDHDNRI
jgi:hypothetical protein